MNHVFRIFTAKTVTAICMGILAAVSSAFAEVPALKYSDDAYVENPEWWMKRFEEKQSEIKAGGAEYVFIGDSITHFWETKGKSTWNKYFNGPDAPYRALNIGFGGDRTENVLWRIEHGELDGYKAKWIVLMIGTNNNGHRGRDKEVPQDTVDGIKRILDKIIEKQPEAKIILHPIFPCGKTTNDSVRVRNEIVNREIYKFVDEERIFWVNFNEKLMKPDGSISWWMMHDALHPTGKGYKIWAEAILPYFNGTAEAKKKPQWTEHEGGALTSISRNQHSWWRKKFERNRRIISECGGGIEFIMMGDSITHYWEIGEGPDTSRDIEELEKYCTTMNCGYGGDAIQSLRWRVQNGELEGYKAKVISVLIGTNNKDPDDVITEGIRTLLDDIREKQPDSVILLNSILPRGAGIWPGLIEINKKLKSFCDGKKTIYVDLAKDYVTPDGKLIEDMFYDRLHLSDKGIHHWLEVLKPILAELIGREWK